MATKLSILMLSAFLVAQIVHALPTGKSESSSSEQNENGNKIATDSSEEDGEMSDRLELLIFTVAEFYVLSKTTLEEGKIVYENVAKEAATAQNKSEALEKCINEIEKFVHKLDNLTDNSDAISELFEVATDFNDIWMKYNYTEADKPTPEVVFIASLLEKHGLEELDKSYEKGFTTFTNKFNRAIERYFNKLSDKQKQSEREVKLISWHKEFKDESDLEKKALLFEKFFDLIS